MGEASGWVLYEEDGEPPEWWYDADSAAAAVCARTGAWRVHTDHGLELDRGDAVDVADGKASAWAALVRIGAVRE